MKKKFEDLQKEDITSVKADPRTKEAIGGITDFYKVACKKCKRKLTKFIPLLITFKRGTNVEEWVDKNICEDCKKFLV